MGRILYWPTQSILRRTTSTLIATLVLGGFFCQCNSLNTVQPPFKGSIENPICSDGAYAQRLYLRRLRTSLGKPVKYEREDPIVGPDQTILDRYLIWQEDQSFFSLYLFDTSKNLSSANQDSPLGKTRIYMNLYRPNCVENQPPPMFLLSNSSE